MTARQSGGRRHDERSGVEDTTQGNWAADGMTEGGGRTTHARWWLILSLPHECSGCGLF